MASEEQHHTLALPRFERPVKLLIVVAPYYKAIAEGLLAGARAEIARAGARSDVAEVPGALEIPAAIAIAHRQSNFDGFVALGCVIRGETTHYDTVCNDSSRGLMLLGLRGLCIGNAILTVENMEQAVARADPSGMNKGAGAAAAALHLVALSRRWGRPGGGAGVSPEQILIAGDEEGPASA